MPDFDELKATFEAKTFSLDIRNSRLARQFRQAFGVVHTGSRTQLMPRPKADETWAAYLPRLTKWLRRFLDNKNLWEVISLEHRKSLTINLWYKPDATHLAAKLYIASDEYKVQDLDTH